MSEILEIVSVNEIVNLNYIKQLLHSVLIKDELINYLEDLDYRSFNDIQHSDEISKIKLSHCINFLIDNRKNVYKIINFEKLKKKKIKIKDIINFHSYTKWINVYKLIAYLAKMNS